MDNIIKNYEEVLEKPPSTRLFLKFLKHKFDAKRRYKKELKKNNSEKHEEHNLPPEGIEIYSFAVVLDDVVVDVMNVQKEFGEKIKYGAQFVFLEENQLRPLIGWVYKDGKFMTLQDVALESKIVTRG